MVGASKHGDTALRQAYHRGIRQGYVSVTAADQLAVRLLGAHPIELWGDAWLIGVDDACLAGDGRAARPEPGTVVTTNEAPDGQKNGSTA